MRGEGLLTAEAVDTFQNPMRSGADISYGQYLLGSYWKAGIRGTQYEYTPEDGEAVQSAHVAAYGEWMYRLAGTRSRLLNLYGGGGVFLGYEVYDPWQRMWDLTEKEELGDGAFLYGIHLRMEAELFFCRRAAVVLSGQLPVNFTSPFKWIYPQASLGIRVNI